MKTAVITGASGFLGSALAKQLLQDGVRVYGVGTKIVNLSELAGFGDFIPVIAGFDQYLSLPDMIEEREIDVFYHFAWEGGFTTAIKDYKLQMRNAGYAGDAVIAANGIHAKRFVYANTYNQYEIINLLNSVTFQPRYTCIYSTAKTAASLVCRTLSYNLGIHYCAGLIPMPYGVNNYSKQLVNVVINALNNGISPKLIEGNNYYDLVHVDDIANAFIAIGKYGNNMKEYYVGHRELKTFKEWITEIKDIIAPNVDLKFGEYKDKQLIDYSMIDLDALYRDTGFECKIELRDSIKEVANWVKYNLKFE